ncbi:MAG: hypothetical protein P8N49_06400 [Opitutales bacterium]|nr:hypothetical protein [Opitutales bacterium]
MKKLIILLLTANLCFSWTPAQDNSSVEKAKVFPAHWGKTPNIQTQDFVDLPKGFGKGSSTLKHWINGNLRKDFADQPKMLSEREKLYPKIVEAEVMSAVKDGTISKEDARKKLNSLREEMAKKGNFKRPQRAPKPELSSEVKEKIEAVKELEKSIHTEMKARVEELGKDASREEIKSTVESFKETNKDRFKEIKEAHSSIRQDLEANRPAKPERPELNEDLKVKVEALQAKRKEMHEAHKELHQNLKDASKEDRKVMIADFKETNKEKHQEIKAQAKQVKEGIRELVETEATRTSDL